MVSYITTLFRSKPPGGSLPVLSAHSFASTDTLVFFNQQKRVIIFYERVCHMRESITGQLFVKHTCYRPIYFALSLHCVSLPLYLVRMLFFSE